MLFAAVRESGWHETDMPRYLGDVRCWVNSGNHMLAWSFSGFDLELTKLSLSAIKGNARMFV
jgi:hypothetical protein